MVSSCVVCAEVITEIPTRQGEADLNGAAARISRFSGLLLMLQSML